MNDKKITFIDLFAGGGGLSEGFISQGSFQPIVHVEMNKHAAMTIRTRICYHYLQQNDNIDLYRMYQRGEISRDELFDSMPEGLLDTVINKEISNETTDEIFSSIDSIMHKNSMDSVDIIIGGPPCQAYSLLGRARDKNGMVDDHRNFLYKQYVRFIEKYKPKLFVFENVLGILTANEGITLNDLVEKLEAQGYCVERKVLNSHDFGVLQRRKRVIIIGWKKNLKLKYPEFDTDIYEGNVDEILSDLVELSPGETKNQYIDNPTEYLRWSNIRNENDILTCHECRMHNDRDREIYKLAN